MANLVFYPYQLENGSYIDKVSGKAFGKGGSGGTIPTYPANTTPYKTPNDYLGGGMYKPYDTKKSFIYIENYVLDKLTDFTICFWLKGASGGVLTFVDDFYSSSYYSHDGFTIYYDGFWYNTPVNKNYYKFSINNKSRWSFYEYTFKKVGSNYFVTCFYHGEKKFNIYIDVKYFKKSYIVLGAWTPPEYIYLYGFDGYMYDLSIYNKILHAENYNEFPKKEMNYISNIRYIGMEKENNLYGMI